MSAEDFDAESARAQIATADAQQLAVRRADLDRLSLLVLAAAQIAFAVIVVILSSHSVVLGLFPVSLIPVLLVSPFSFWRERNERVFSRGGRRIFWATLATYTAWVTLLLWWISPHIGWQTRPPDWHFVPIAAISVIPLLFGAWLIGRVRWE